MADVDDEIRIVQTDIDVANAAVAKALRERRAVKNNDPSIAELDAAIATAKAALLAAEVRMRTLYESRHDKGTFNATPD